MQWIPNDFILICVRKRNYMYMTTQLCTKREQFYKSHAPISYDTYRNTYVHRTKFLLSKYDFPHLARRKEDRLELENFFDFVQAY